MANFFNTTKKIIFVWKIIFSVVSVDPRLLSHCVYLIVCFSPLNVRIFRSAALIAADGLSMIRSNILIIPRLFAA